MQFSSNVLSKPEKWTGFGDIWTGLWPWVLLY